ncbi:cyclic nucleotide-binding domain-containing protein [bacterium]|nr:cyclic nucleotide-binding domain-containing protein [bacterium]
MDESKLERIIGILGEAEVLSEISGREAFAPHLDLIECQPGYEVISQGDCSQDIYILVSGELKVVAKRDDHAEKVAGIVGSGVIGEVVFLAGASVRTASVIALSHSVLLRLTKEGFDSVRAEHPGEAADFIEALSRRISTKLFETTKKLVDVKGRLTEIAKGDGDDDLSAIRDGINHALQGIMGGPPDECWVRFMQLQPEIRDRALEYAEKLAADNGTLL